MEIELHNIFRGANEAADTLANQEVDRNLILGPLT